MTAAEKLVGLLQLKPNQAVVVHNGSNMFYLTGGYTGEGVVLIGVERRTIVTDFRYTEQAERQAPGFEVVMTAQGTPCHDQWITEACRRDGIDTLYFEDRFLTVRDFHFLSEIAGDDLAFLPLDAAIEQVRQVKEAHEIDCIRRACQITSRAFDQVLPLIREGMTEIELRIELDNLQLKLGAEANSFATIIASGENGSLCHAIPGQRRLRQGDMITMDFGCKVGGYCSDMTRTVALGTPSDEMRRVYDTVYRAQAMCENAVAPGKNCFDIDRMARDFIDSQGYAGRFGHGLGHSVGIDIHEDPRFNQVCHDTLVPGIVITVEPGVYLPGVGGVRIENTVLVTPTGHEALTTAPRELIIL